MKLLRRFITFIEALFGTSTSAMTLQSAGELGPLGQFILSLSCNETARNSWTSNRAQAIANSGLSPGDQQLLTNGDPVAIASQIVQESGGAGSKLWICTWIRSSSTSH